MTLAFDPLQAASAALSVASDGARNPWQLERIRADRLARLLETCIARSALYRRWLKGIDPSRTQLHELPVVQRSELMRHFDEWIADPSIHLEDLRAFVKDPTRIAHAFAGRYIVWHSSGTSGEPGIFVQDARTMAIYDALEAFRGPLIRWAVRNPGELALPCNLVMIGLPDEHYASTVAMQRLRQLNPWLASRLHNVSLLQPMMDLERALERLRPAVMATFPSVALQLAEERQCGRLDVAPDEIWLGGETLTQPTRRFIEGSFGCRVHDSYGASEFLSIASECRFHALHLNADWVILEPIDEQGHPVGPDNESDAVLLTHLGNHLQPLMRYRLADRITLCSTPCACGSSLPVIKVQGRDDDMLRLPGARRRTLSVSPLAVATIIEQRGGLLAYQLRQTSRNELVLSCAAHDSGSRTRLPRAATELAHFLAGLGAVGVRVTPAVDGTLMPGAGGKMRRIVAAARADAFERAHCMPAS